jgi:hypothetical protein
MHGSEKALELKEKFMAEVRLSHHGQQLLLDYSCVGRCKAAALSKLTVIRLLVIPRSR